MFQKNSNGSKVICERCSFAKLLWQNLHWENIKTNFWSGANKTWEYLKEGVWRLRSANTLSRPTYKSLVCNHVLNTIQIIIRNTYIYVKPMYSIEFRIIFKTYIPRSILFNLNLNPNPRNLRKENPNAYLRNPRKELKSFVKLQEDIKCCLERWRMVFLKLQFRN